MAIGIKGVEPQQTNLLSCYGFLIKIRIKLNTEMKILTINSHFVNLIS